MLYVCVLCASCGSSQCCILHDLQFVNAGRGCKRPTIWKRHTPAMGGRIYNKSSSPLSHVSHPFPMFLTLSCFSPLSYVFTSFPCFSPLSYVSHLFPMFVTSLKRFSPFSYVCHLSPMFLNSFLCFSALSRFSPLSYVPYLFPMLLTSFPYFSPLVYVRL